MQKICVCFSKKNRKIYILCPVTLKLMLGVLRLSVCQAWPVTTAAQVSTARSSRVSKKINQVRFMIVLFSELTLVHSTWTELNRTSRPSYTTRSLVTRVRVTSHDSRLCFVLIGCSETKTDSARLVLSTCILPQQFTLEFANCSSV